MKKIECEGNGQTPNPPVTLTLKKRDAANVGLWIA
jgi:hypothetical protein